VDSPDGQRGGGGHDEDLVHSGNFHGGGGRRFIHQDITAVETALAQIGGFFRKSLHQGIEKTDRLVTLHPAEPLGGQAVVPEALGFRLFERFDELAPASPGKVARRAA